MKRSWMLIVAAAAAALSCGEDDVTAPADPVTITPLASSTIGAAGGRIDVPARGVALVVPAGALDADTEITIGERSDPPARAVGPALELGPDGLTFDVPVRLELDVDALPAGALPSDLRIVTRSGGRWITMGRGAVDATSVSSATASMSLAHFSSYSIVTVDQTSVLYGTFGFATDDIYGYGMGSVVAHYDGTDVTAANVGLGAATRLYDGFGADAGEQVCVGWDGSDGRVWRSADGSVWSPDATPAGAGGRPLFGVDGVTGTTIAVGFLGRILVNTGAAWTDESYTTAGGQASLVRHLRDVTVLPSGDAIAVGDEIVLMRSGGAWSEVDVTALFGGNRFFLDGVWARDAADIYAVGREFDAATGNDVAVVLHDDGTGWTRMGGVPAGTAFHGVWGDAARVLVAAEAGRIHRWEGGTWADEPLCESSSETFFDVWTSGPDVAAAVGGGAVFALAMEDCDDGGGGGGSGEPGDLVVGLAGAPGGGCEGTSWTEGAASMDVYADDGGCGGGCGFTPLAAGVRLHPSQLRILLPGQYSRCEVDVDNAGGAVVVTGWYAGEPVGVSATTTQGSSTITMQASNPEGFYLIYVAACDAVVDEVRFYE